MWLTKSQINTIVQQEQKEAEEWGLSQQEVKEYLFVIRCAIRNWSQATYNKWLQASLPA